MVGNDTEPPTEIKILLAEQYQVLPPDFSTRGSQQLQEQMMAVNENAHQLGWDIFALVRFPPINVVIK